MEMEPPPRYKVFLSHTGKNKEDANFVSSLYTALEKLDAGATFVDFGAIETGDQWRSKIRKAVQNCQVFVCILSKEFFESKWCMIELHEALRSMKEHQKNGKVLPYTLQDCPPDCTSKGFIEEFKHFHTGMPKELVIQWTNNLEELDDMQCSCNEFAQNHKPRTERFKDRVVKEIIEHLKKSSGTTEAPSKEEVPVDEESQATAITDEVAQVSKTNNVGTEENETHSTTRDIFGFKPILKIMTCMGLLGAGITLVFVNQEDAEADNEAIPLPTIVPTKVPTAFPTATPFPCGEPCSTGTVCLDPLAQRSCCTECKRFQLNKVKTAGDGEGGDVEPIFYINGVELFGGRLELPRHSFHVFSRQPNAVGNIRPYQTVELRVLEEDAGCVDVLGLPLGDCHDDDRITLHPDQWYKPQVTPYDKVTHFKNWAFFNTITTECCTD